MARKTFKAKIPVQCVDNALGHQAVVVNEDQTYPLSHHEEGGTGYYYNGTGLGSTDNSSVKVFHPARGEVIHLDVEPSNTDSLVRFKDLMRSMMVKMIGLLIFWLIILWIYIFSYN